MTNKEAWKQLYEEREYAYADKVNHKGITWSNDIRHYDSIGECLRVIENDLEMIKLFKDILKGAKILKKNEVDMSKCVTILSESTNEKIKEWLEND